MATLEERVAYLEGRVSEQTQTTTGLENRFDSIDRRFDIVERRFDAVDRRLDRLDEKVSRQFVWVVGIQVTTLMAIVGALLARP